MAGRRHEKPLPRVNPSGEKVWVARYTGRDGKRRSAGTFKRKGPCDAVPDLESRRPVECCAQHAIDLAYDAEYGGQPRRLERDTVGGYFETWLRRHPRTERTERAYTYRIQAVLNVRLERLPFRNWLMMDVRRREVVDLLDVLLREHGRAASGARGVLSTLSAMWEDAIVDDRAESNPFLGVRVRASDPRVRKAKRLVRIYSWEQMRSLVAAAPSAQAAAMIQCLSDLGLRLGEMLPLERADVMADGCGDSGCSLHDVPHIHVCKTAHDGNVERGTKTTRGQSQAGRAVPLGPGLAEQLRSLPARLDTRLLFPAASGRVMQNRSFYSDVWRPARKNVPGLEKATPHELRHSWVSHMRAAGVDPAELAAWSGHTVTTATVIYTHATMRPGSVERALRTLPGGAG